jgi:hypothetical protein
MGNQGATELQYKLLELKYSGYCVLKSAFTQSSIDACRDAIWPQLLAYLDAHRNQPNRGTNRYFLPMPFEPPCFAPEFFFNQQVLRIVRAVMDDRIVADQWGCDVSLPGSDHQGIHIDYQRPLFAESPDLPLPPYMLVASFGLLPITPENGPIEIAPATHDLPRKHALQAVEAGEIKLEAVPLEIGDVLIRNPWALHRGSPNTTGTPRALASIRYVRRWYADDSRDVNAIPRAVWQSLTLEQQAMMRFPIEDASGPQ